MSSDSHLPAMGDDAAAIRETAAAQRAALTRQTHALRAQHEAAKAEIEAQQKALADELARRTADLLAQMKPMQEQLAKMEEVLWTVNLYLGRDETLQLLRDGQPAPADTPIESLAGMLNVIPRTVRAWESGTDPIPYRVPDEVAVIEDYAAHAVDELVVALRADPDPVIVTYRRDEDMHAARPDTAHLPARWWRHVVARAAHDVRGVHIVDLRDVAVDAHAERNNSDAQEGAIR